MIKMIKKIIFIMCIVPFGIQAAECWSSCCDTEENVDAKKRADFLKRASHEAGLLESSSLELNTSYEQLPGAPEDQGSPRSRQLRRISAHYIQTIGQDQPDTPALQQEADEAAKNFIADNECCGGCVIL